MRVAVLYSGRFYGSATPNWFASQLQNLIIQTMPLFSSSVMCRTGATHRPMCKLRWLRALLLDF